MMIPHLNKISTRFATSAMIGALSMICSVQNSLGLGLPSVEPHCFQHVQRGLCLSAHAGPSYFAKSCNKALVSRISGGNDISIQDNGCKYEVEKSSVVSRREALKYYAFGAAYSGALFMDPAKVSATDNVKDFRSGGYGKEEYSNAFTASRDTNISPKEAYDSINSRYVMEPAVTAKAEKRVPRALDVGAGAGVSTQFLWEQGYRSIDALDWSGSAWDRFVIDDVEGYCPPSVKFYELDDERFRVLWRKDRLERYDTIVFNFAVNDSKAREFAAEMLNDNGHLLAPVNTQQDYWLKQAYKCYDRTGNILWQTTDVGAWSVQFQPDVTQDTCQGIWCAPFNGFKKMGTASNSLW